VTKNASTPAPARDEHYSYATYADPRMAETFEAARFGGPIGRLLAETQEQVIASFLSPLTGSTILDVGTGTGRAAIALARRGATVTGIDASGEMLAVARRRALEAGTSVTFVQGDAHGLTVADRSFDAVVCLRVLMHTPDWRQSIAELCRAARDRVVLDYPARSSAAALQSIARRIAHAFGARVEAFRVFGLCEIREALEANGFRILDTHKQFVLPIAFHKRLGSAAVTARIEGALDRVGLRGILGSPVTLVAQRVSNSQLPTPNSQGEPFEESGEQTSNKPVGPAFTRLSERLHFGSWALEAGS
jgi:ubiquinone/menaquinone biosynthesis C-methylase UbiE